VQRPRCEGQGAIQELFECTVAYLTERQQLGVPIGSFQVLQHIAADMFSETELCKSAMILAASQVDSPDDEIRNQTYRLRSSSLPTAVGSFRTARFDSSAVSVSPTSWTKGSSSSDFEC